MKTSPTLDQPAKGPRTNRLRAVNVSRTNRSAVSNGSTVLAGVDGRSAEGRRYRDLVISYAEPLGGVASLSEENSALVRQCAALTMQSERMQSAIVRGEAVDCEQVTRIANALSRTLSAIRSRRRPQKGPSALERIVARHAEAAGK